MKNIVNKLFFKSLLLLLLCLVHTQNHAQNWSPIGAEWFYSLPSINPIGDYVSYISQKDTLVGNVLSKKIIKQNSTGNVLDFEIMYENNDSIFYWFQGNYHLLYDFSIQIGDTTQYEFKSYNSQLNDTILQVKGYATMVNNVTIGGTTLKKIEVSIIPIAGLINNYIWPPTFTYTQQIGYDKGDNYLIYKINLPSTLEHPSLRCYNEIMLSYKTPFWDVVGNNNSCDYITGIDEEEKSATIKLYPNPSSNHLIIENLGQQKNDVTVEIRSVTGKLELLKNIGLVDKTIINTSKIPAGVYFVTVKDEQNIIAIKKWVKAE